MRKVLVGIILLSTIGMAGCGLFQKAVNTAIEETAGTAATVTGKKVGTSVGEQLGSQIGGAIVRTYTPQLMAVYVSAIFGYAFNAGSYWIHEDYAEGQWTRWRALSATGEEQSTLEKAFLKRTDEQNEWWRVKFHDVESEDTVVMEGLFSPQRAELLRLRAKFPGQEAGEVPVQTGTPVYVASVPLTEESLEGATVGTERVTVPAGTFTAKHVRYLDAATGGSVEWYLSDEVPGRLVKYRVESRNLGEEGRKSKEAYVFELTAYGSGAQSELGSF